MNLKVFHGEDVIDVDVGKKRHVVDASCNIDLVLTWICQSCYMDMLKLLHGFVKVLTLICHSCYMHLLQLQRGFVKVVAKQLAGWMVGTEALNGRTYTLIQGLAKTGVECMGDIP